jgi:hypothetical protein
VGITVGGIEFYAGPTVLGAPDDLESVIVDFIADARTSLRVAVQEIDSRTIAQALLAEFESRSSSRVTISLSRVRSRIHGLSPATTRTTGSSIRPCSGLEST